jgi:caffeoyl-CoA O-methyltransferase
MRPPINRALQRYRRTNLYALEHSALPSEACLELVKETARVAGPAAAMQLHPAVGPLLTALVRAADAAEVIEIGTFTGLSTIFLAAGVRPGGRVATYDLHEEWVRVARPFWEQAGVTSRIAVNICDARRALADLEPYSVDLAFVDGSKTEYIDYYDLLIPALRVGGILVADNAVGERVPNPMFQDTAAIAIRAFNKHVQQDGRVDQYLVDLGEGVLIAHRL